MRHLGPKRTLLQRGYVPFNISWISTAQNVASQTTYTFSGQNIGPANKTRLVVVGIAALTANVAINSVTVGGLSATQISGCLANTETSGCASDLWYIKLPSISTASVVVTFASAMTRCAIQIWNVVGTGASLGASSNLFNQSTTSTTAINAAVTIPVGGGAIVNAMNHNSATTGHAGTGGANLDNATAFGNSYQLGGHTTAPLSGSQTLGFSWTTGTDCALSLATFNP